LSERYRVHALDLPGFGNAPDVSGDISAEAYLSLVHEGVLGLIKNEPAAVLASRSVVRLLQTSRGGLARNAAGWR